MGLFGNQYGNQNDEQYQRNMYLSQYRVARNEIMMAVAFTAINIVLLLINGLNNGVAFLFSITVPYYCVGYGMAFTNEFGSAVFLASGIIAALIMLGLYIMFFVLSKERPGCLTTLLIMFSVDTLAVTVMLFLFGFDASALFDVLFHALILFNLVRGVNAASKLKELGVEVNHPFYVVPVAPDNAGAERSGEPFSYPVNEDKEEREEEEQPEAPEPAYRTEPDGEWDGEGKTRLSAVYNGSDIRVVRKFSCTALIIDGGIYDTYDRIIETDYTLCAEVNGVKYVYSQNKYGGASLSADGEIVATGTFSF